MRERKPCPPHDCRITQRCLKETFELRLPLDASFASLRSENSCIDAFFERRENDPDGGERGERIAQVRSRPVFSLHSGRMRGVTWFQTDLDRGLVWLLAAEIHDDRHKGSSDAYDIFAALNRAGRLFPADIDYRRLELDRRREDTSSFADDVRRDAAELVEASVKDGHHHGTLASIPARSACVIDGGLRVLSVAVSRQPVQGLRSGLDFPLTDERFLLLAEAVRQAAEAIFGPEVLRDEIYSFEHGELRNERAFALMFELR